MVPFDRPLTGQKFPRVPARLRGHVLRLARQDGGLRPIFRFHRQVGDECAAVVCDNFSWTRGVRIFTPEKEQLRENVARSGHRPLALELAADFVPRRRNVLWDHLHGYLLRFGQRAADMFCHLKMTQRKNHQQKQNYEHKNTRMLGKRPQRSRGQNHIST